ncbi:hypothetical protein Psed_4359 [Pseudonocardia dioxanivorans CB1190]|uniref:Uncharacterized protein n=1 Tax=Pseudonocardia dioxanivorans (strain ATCC 55486 / DSM 44775 / JCM 13855 / CB1190) TaxID=675635 RepID=F4CXE3_PSEUX|nr:hypothetical protein [Pseudonocardia dioxanivorans]AEA26517.1 hypothetical protein Psed_4359 [Pseudonocardia dioxanivorans CB1190]
MTVALGLVVFLGIPLLVCALIVATVVWFGRRRHRRAGTRPPRDHEELTEPILGRPDPEPHGRDRA